MFDQKRSVGKSGLTNGVSHENKISTTDTPGKKSLTEAVSGHPQIAHGPAEGEEPIQRSEHTVRAEGFEETSTTPRRSHEHHWNVPDVDLVATWLSHWVTLWTTIAGQAFSKFSAAVQTDSNKSSNVGALISLAGNALWVFGGELAPEVSLPVEIFGASTSSIGAFVHGGHDGQPKDIDILNSMQKGLDKFSNGLNNGVDNRNTWVHILKDHKFRSAGSDKRAHAVLRKLLHLPNTDDQGQLRYNIEFNLIGKYLQLKGAFIHRDIYHPYGITDPQVEDHLKNVSGDVADAFGTIAKGLDPMPTKDGVKTGNPFNLEVRKQDHPRHAGPA